MKRNLSDKKATLMILLVVVGLLGIIIIPLIISSNSERNKESFPEYHDIKITEKKLGDEKEYNNIREQLENDFYFKKLTIMDYYDKDEYSSAMLQDMLWTFMFNYEITNTQYFSSKNVTTGVYCMTKERFIDAFKELFDVDITDDISYLPGYHRYIYKQQGNYCMFFNNVANDYDNEIKVAVERMAIFGTTVTTDIYVYEYYTMDNKNNNVRALDDAIKFKEYSAAESIVKDNLNGKVTHKQLQLEVNGSGKYFKYRLLSIKELDY